MKVNILRLAGGLGNQLFQFAAALRLAKRPGSSFGNILIDTRFLASYEAKHTYDIGFISNLFPNVHVAQQLPFMASMASRLRLAKIFDKRIGSYDLISSLEHFNQVYFRGSPESTFILDGYFQHPDIIFTEKDRSRVFNSLYTAKKPLIDQLKGGSPAIGIHIRRGDYVTSKSAAKVFRNISIDYYDKGLQQIRHQQKVLVFSDDQELAASYASKVGGVDVRQLKLSLEDEFCLLMSCDDHIIANSTFSWWAAYLGHRFKGHVIAPKNWYHDKTRSQINPLLLPHFELIDA